MKNVKSIIPQLLLLASAAFWGTSFIITKGLFLAEKEITPIIIITGRMLVATLFAMPLLMATGKMERIRNPKHLLFFLLLSFTEPFLYSICETTGTREVSGSLASIVIATIPLLIPFGMRLVYKEKLSIFAVIGIAISLGGIAIMSSGENNGNSNLVKGLILLSLAVLIAVIYTLILVRILGKYRPTTITAYQNLFALIYFLPILLVKDLHLLPSLSYSPQMLFSILFLGIFCSTVAYMCFNYGMNKMGATVGSAYNNIIPVFSLLFAVLLGQETLGWVKVLGMVVALAGLFVAQWQPPKKIKSHGSDK